MDKKTGQLILYSQKSQETLQKCLTPSLQNLFHIYMFTRYNITEYPHDDILQS